MKYVTMKTDRDLMMIESLDLKAPALPFARPRGLRLTDNYLRGPFTPWRSAPLGRTEKSRLCGGGL